jgi:uncharacterized repeat protein (TIGR02059 family)
MAFLCFSFTLSATTYFIDPSGNNSNNGSSAAPWKTLSYACSKAIASGDIIRINKGTYYESSQSNPAVGVSIVGESQTGVHIFLSYNGSSTNAAINFSSASANTNGNQSISYLTLEGAANFATSDAISVYNRSHVTIDHCTILNFNKEGVSFVGDLSNHSRDNVLSYCTMTDCSQRDGGYGSIRLKGQDGLLVHDNTLSNVGRPLSYNGNLVNGVSGGISGFKFYNNKCTKPSYDGDPGDYQSTRGWNFHIEIWETEGGCEYYNNEFYGGDCFIDIGSSVSASVGNYKGSYTYSNNIHNNLFEFHDKYPVGDPGNNKVGITLEDCNMNDVIIEKNHFKNLPFCIGIAMGSNDYGPYNNIDIRYNLFENVGFTTDDRSFAIQIKSYASDKVYNNIRVVNNVMTGGDGSSGQGRPMAFVETYLAGTINGLTIQNNISENAYKAWFYTEAGTGSTGVINKLTLTNNISYNNANSNLIYDANNIIDARTFIHNEDLAGQNPSFVNSSDFRLQSGSPAIGKGIVVAGMTTDFSGIPVKSPPSIGAYESGSSATPTAAPLYLSSVVENTTPSVLQINFNLALASIVPVASAFSVSVNSVPVTPSAIAVSGSSLNLTLASAIKYGDIITVSYTKPSSNPVQTSAGGQAISVSGKPVTNNLVNPVKTGTQVSVTMTISPNHVHKTMNALVAYSGDITSLVTSLMPQLVRIYDISGRLFVEKALTTGITGFKIPLNLRSGVYIVKMLAGGLELSSQKIIVY